PSQDRQGRRSPGGREVVVLAGDQVGDVEEAAGLRRPGASLREAAGLSASRPGGRHQAAPRVLILLNGTPEMITASRRHSATIGSPVRTCWSYSWTVSAYT